MTVQVKLFALLRRYHPGPNRSTPLSITLPEGSTVADLIALLNLPDDLVRAAFVNGEKLPLDTLLHEGDLVSMFSAVVGG